MEGLAQYFRVGLPPLVEDLFGPGMFFLVDEDVVGSVGFTYHPALLPRTLVINHRMQSSLLELLANRPRVFSFFEGQNCDWFHKFTPLIVKPLLGFYQRKRLPRIRNTYIAWENPHQKGLKLLRKRYFAVDTPRSRRV